MSDRSGRKLYQLAGGGKFIYARWNAAGDRIFAVTRDRRVLTIDSSTGSLVREETLPLATPVHGRLLDVAFDANAGVQAYSVIQKSADLYLASGIR
jgi:hypothetical protein